MKKLLFSAFALVAVLGGAAQSLAQDKPVVTLSIASYDEIMADIDFIGSATGVPEINRQTIEGQLQQANAADALKALDKSKPMGLLVLTDGQGDFRPIVFAPITDVKKFVEPFAGALPITVEDAGDGILKVGSPQPGQEAYAKSQGGYTYFAQSAAQLATLPADPQTLLGGLEKEYDFGVRAYLQNVPPFLKNIAIGQLKQGVQLGLQREPGEDETAFQVRKRLIYPNYGRQVSIPPVLPNTAEGGTYTRSSFCRAGSERIGYGIVYRYPPRRQKQGESARSRGPTASSSE